MDESSIRLIQETAVDAAGARIPADFEDRVVALPTDYQLHDLERFMEGRARFRGALLTDSITDFVEYVKRRAAPQPDMPQGAYEAASAPLSATASQPAPGFIDAEKLSATVYFNLGDDTQPGHADDTAKLALKPTAPFAAALAVSGRPMLQKDAIDWLEDWSGHVDFRDDVGESVSTSAALAAIRKITIRSTAEATTSQESFRSSRSALEDVEARGAQALPSELRFYCAPYSGLTERFLRLRLSVLTSGDKPQLVLRIRNLEAEKEAIAQDFKRELLGRLEGVATLTIGTFTP